jgi:tRNA threonylcarbamoyl adenosine modification protein YjeE
MVTDLHTMRDLRLKGEAATLRLAIALASCVEPGDILALSGGLGSGKTSLARGFLRARAGDPDLEVPSPTFTLVQIYDLTSGSVWHLDLYRLKRPEEVWELGFEEALDQAILLIEWPERIAGLLPRARLDITFTLDPDDPESRHVRLTAGPGWVGRLDGILRDA